MRFSLIERELSSAINLVEKSKWVTGAFIVVIGLAIIAGAYDAHIYRKQLTDQYLEETLKKNQQILELKIENRILEMEKDLFDTGTI